MLKKNVQEPLCEKMIMAHTQLDAFLTLPKRHRKSWWEFIPPQSSQNSQVY